MSITVSIVEDDIHYNQSLKKIIDYDEDLLCVGCFYSGEEALKNIESLHPDLVLMDIKLPDFSGVELVAALKARTPLTQYVMCTSFENDKNVFDSLKAGAAGYLLKGESMENIISGIKACYAGGTPLSNPVAKKLVHYFSGRQQACPQFGELSVSEREILRLLATGLQYKEIAAQKFITIDTVKKHIANIYRKLQVNNKVEAVNKFNGTT